MRELPVMICVANPEDSESADQVYSEIEQGLEESSASECYRLDRRQGVAAAIEFVTILGRVADIASIAALLWMAYDKVMARRRSRQRESFLYVAVDPEKGLHWSLGKDFTDKDVFIKDFTAKVTSHVQQDEHGRPSRTFTAEVRGSGMWIRTR